MEKKRKYNLIIGADNKGNVYESTDSKEEFISWLERDGFTESEIEKIFSKVLDNYTICSYNYMDFTMNLDN